MARRTVKEVSDDLDKLQERCEHLRSDIIALDLRLSLLQQSAATADKEISGVLNTFTWMWRTVAGLFIAACVAFVVSGGLSK